MATVLKQTCFIGTDLVELSRIRKLYLKHSEQFIDSICSASEKKSILGKKDIVLHLAQFWAAKEAVYKLLHTNLDAGIGWKEMTIIENKKRQFTVRLFGKAKKRAIDLNIQKIFLSLSHTDSVVTGLAVSETKKNPRTFRLGGF